MSLSPVPAVPHHPNVQAVSALLGVWHGIGTGTFPTIAPFQYEEEIAFSTSGRPFVAYTSRTWRADSARAKPMHEENGFLRFVGGPQACEGLLTQCTGVQEVLAGSWSRDDEKQIVTLVLNSTSLARTPSAKEPHVQETRRTYTFDLDGESLEYTVAMATPATPLTAHLQCKLSRAQNIVADDDEEEEEQLEDTFLEPDVERHAHHHHGSVDSASSK